MRHPLSFEVYALTLLLLACPALAQAPEPAQPPDPARYSRELQVDEITRSYQLFVPPAPSGNLPLLVVLHGRGGSGSGMAERSAFSELVPAVVAYPDGLDGQWNYLTGLGGNDGVDDVNFIHGLVAEIAGTQPVDPAAIYVAGYSNGGFMVQRLACEADSPFSGFASVAAGGFGGMPRLCDQPRPLSMALVHGTGDEVVPWSGKSTVLGGREILLSASVPESFAYWANFAGCGGASDRRSIPLPGPRPESIEVLRVTDCPEGAEVVLYAVVGGGHEWPRASGATGAFDVSRTILEFFGLESGGG